MNQKEDIDVLENSLRNKGDLLDILLLDRSTGKNIIWATDSYISNGKEFDLKKRIKPELVTGFYGKLIQPRAAKSLQEQRRRTRDKAEVFTPLFLVKYMNSLLDGSSKNYPLTNKNWQEYVREVRLEITCGEAPFIVGRYNTTSHSGTLTKLNRRIGFLDKKLQAVSKYCEKQNDWILWAKEAYKASYGYEWQGDNVLLARENLLYTFIDYYSYKFKRKPSLALQQEIAEIVSWNIFQMDGIKYVAPMSCKHINRVIPGELTLFGETPETVERDECEGCKYNRPEKHNGRYAKTMDWNTGRPIRFIDILK